MNSIPYRDFPVHGGQVKARRAASRPPRGLFRRVVDAIELSRQRAAERDIARYLAGRLGNPAGLTDEIERRLFEHLIGNRGFRP